MNRSASFFLTIALGLATAPPRAAALGLEAAFARRLLRARSSANLEALRRRFERAREARASCAMQIARGSAPLECYEVLGLERAWDVLDETRYRAKRRRLDVACASAALRLEVPETKGPHSFVSPACRARVAEARAIRRYRRAETGWSGD